MRKGKIKLFQARNLMWCFRVVAANGEIVAQSEQYSSKQMAKKGIRSLIVTAIENIHQV